MREARPAASGGKRAATRLTICDVGPRDGLQNEATILEPRVRADLVERLGRCGIRKLEVASFVSPTRVPAMAGAEAVVAAFVRTPGVTYAGLVLNERGYERLRATGLDEVRMAVAATETFGRRNANAGVDEAIDAAGRIAERSRADGLRVSVTLSVAFGCPFEGHVAESRVLELVERIRHFGPDEIVLADTIGVAAPAEVGRLVSAVAGLGGDVGVHLHDTRNTAVANSYAAIEAGATLIDTSVGGIGGCPFAPGATGNLATEDLVYALGRDGIETGIDLAALVEVAHWLAGRLGHPLAGRVQGVAT